MTVNEESLSFGQLVCKNKPFEDITLGSRKAYFTIIFIDQMINRPSPAFPSLKEIRKEALKHISLAFREFSQLLAHFDLVRNRPKSHVTLIRQPGGLTM